MTNMEQISYSILLWIPLHPQPPPPPHFPQTHTDKQLTSSASGFSSYDAGMIRPRIASWSTQSSNTVATCMASTPLNILMFKLDLDLDWCPADDKIAMSDHEKSKGTELAWFWRLF